LKITPCTAEAASRRRHVVSSVVAFGGSWSSIFYQAKLNARLPSSAAITPSTIPTGL
jgi:hypothetical protein